MLEHQGLRRLRNKGPNTWSEKTECGNPWPLKTNTHCWWCRHPFDTTPIPLPVVYDDRTDVFKTRGTFCSWSCAKAFSISTKEADYPTYNMYLYMLFRRSVDPETARKGYPIAPHWSSLKIFGGSLTIEDFRTRCTPHRNPLSETLYELRNGHAIPVADATKEEEAKVTKDKPLKNLDFTNLTTKKNEPLRLRRNKPLPGKTSNILEKVLGLGFTSDPSHP